MHCLQSLPISVARVRAPAAQPTPAAAAVGTPWHHLSQPGHFSTAGAACGLNPRTHADTQSSCLLSSRPQECISRLQPQQQCRPVGQQRRGQFLQTRAGPIDAAPAWTLDQIAGLVFGAVMVAFYFGSNYVDVFIAKQQRRQLGLCERCGGLNEPATCSQDACPMKSKAPL